LREESKLLLYETNLFLDFESMRGFFHFLTFHA
jgi:hypothetical protein